MREKSTQKERIFLKFYFRKKMRLHIIYTTPEINSNMEQLRNAFVEQKVQKRAEDSLDEVEWSDREDYEGLQISDERVDRRASRDDFVELHMVEFGKRRDEHEIIYQAADQGERQSAGDQRNQCSFQRLVVFIND